MKRTYGSFVVRLTRSGAVLSAGEHRVLELLVSELPVHLREVAEDQFAEYNLVQREIDSRALNFYSVGLFSRTPLPVSRPFDCMQEDAPLIRIAVHISDTKQFRATLTAVRGRVFAASFSERVPQSSSQEFKVAQVVHAWKSNFPMPGAA